MSGNKQKAGVMGWPIEHSLSPRLHNYWLRRYGLPGSYEALAVPPDKLKAALQGLPAQGFRGVNLTIPHKECALELVDDIDTTAKRIGAVNTVIVRENGRLEGRNTDAFGFARNLLAAGMDINGKTATVLGAGGAARAVIVALQDMGAKEIRLANRTQTRAESVQQSLGGNIQLVPWDDLAFADSSLLVNATSLGMQKQPPLEISLRELPPDAVVADLVYAPLRTNLLLEAEKRGHKTVDGLGMLLHQARPAFEAFFGRDPEVTNELRAHVLGGIS